jgi:hypothetical protein
LQLVDGIEKHFLLTEGAVAGAAFAVWHKKNNGLLPLLASLQIADTLVVIESDANPHFFFELLALKGTLETGEDSKEDPQL